MARLACPGFVSEAHQKLIQAAYGDRIASIEHLSGGLHGRCYRVQGADFDNAVRMPPPREDEFRLDTIDEQRVIASVAAVGIAPPAAEVDASLGLVATKYLANARTWTPRDARRLENLDYLAARLKALHACKLELPPYACVGAAEAYAQTAAQYHELTMEQRRWRDDLLELARVFEARFPPETPCHNDLVASNVLDDGEIWLIDFEYAVMSAPILDLASLAGLNDFDANQRARLIGAYYGHYDVPFSADEFSDAVRLVRLLSYFWALAFGGAEDSTESVTAFADSMVAMLR